MNDLNLKSKYLSELREQLKSQGITGAQAERILSETKDHLEQAIRKQCQSGLNRQEAEKTAIELFGSTDRIASGFTRHGLSSVVTDKKIENIAKISLYFLIFMSLAASALTVGFALLSPPEAEPVILTVFKILIASEIAILSILALLFLITNQYTNLAGKSGLVLLIFGITVVFYASYQALFGLDPEYWVIVLGGIFAAQGALTTGLVWRERQFV